jgi:cardiolipin synthase
MTTATKITMFRLVAVPFFIAASVGYGLAGYEGDHAAADRWRWGMFWIFTLAAISDGIDGWVARKFNQQSAFGAALDAVADKTLMFSALMALTFLPGDFVRLPAWYTLLVVVRDASTVAGATWLHYRGRRLEVKPHLTGKAATVVQLVCIGWALLQIRVPDIVWPVGLATALTFISGLLYLRDGLKLRTREKRERSELG